MDGHGATGRAPSTSADSRIYTVKSGDTLESISRAFYGSPSGAERIIEANSAVIRGRADLKPGLQLVIPRPVSAQAG